METATPSPPSESRTANGRPVRNAPPTPAVLCTFVVMDKDEAVRELIEKAATSSMHRFVMVSGLTSLNGVIAKLHDEVTAAFLSTRHAGVFDEATRLCHKHGVPTVILTEPEGLASPDGEKDGEVGQRCPFDGIAAGPVDGEGGVAYLLHKPLTREQWELCVEWWQRRASGGAADPTSTPGLPAVVFSPPTLGAVQSGGEGNSGGASCPAPNGVRSHSAERKDRSVEYTKLWVIGAGAGSIVDLVQDPLTDSVAARKTVIVSVDHRLSDLCTEVEIMKRVTGSPYVLGFYSSFMPSPREFCMFFEYCKYGSLRQHVRRLPKKRLRYAYLAMYAHQLLTAVDHVHSCGVAHRDIKTANILLFDKYHLKLADFGSATTDPRLAGRPAGGTVQYLAPERLIELECTKWKPNSMEALFAEDIWSCGLSLLEIAGAYPPALRNESDMSGFMKVYMTLRDEHRELDFDIPVDGPSLAPLQSSIIAFMRRMIRLNPTERATAAELLSDPFMSTASLARSEDTQLFTSATSLQPSLYSRGNVRASMASSVFTASDFVDDGEDGWSDEDVHMSSVFTPRRER